MGIRTGLPSGIGCAQLDDLQRRLYLALHRGLPGDVSFYRRVSSSARSVLELGVGDARILSQLPVADRTGLDADPGMLDLARERCPEPRYVAADMASFDLGRTFDRVLVPASALFALPGATAQRACFARIAEHLVPGGEAWLDAYGSDAFHEEALPLADDLGRAELEVLPDIRFEGRWVRVYEANVWTKETQRFDIVYWFELDGRIVEQPLVHHYLLTDQIVEMAAAVGLEVIDFFAGFDEEPFRPDAEHVVVGLRRS